MASFPDLSPCFPQETLPQFTRHAARLVASTGRQLRHRGLRRRHRALPRSEAAGDDGSGLGQNQVGEAWAL